jgi:crotonobetainyl-CoA:carnitine CoA-transferase CaiB-like acyl-CoA transferase
MHPQLDQGAPFVWSNRNKKSIALDLKSPQGLALARDLVCRADVLVENFSSGVMRRLGLDHETCLALNPRLVYCSVAAYSREGAFADRFGFDPIAQAESGFVSMNGYPDREGVRALSPVMDISTAMMVGNAVLGALLARERLGRGQRVEVSLFDTAVLMTGYATMQSLFTGKEPQRSGNTAPDTCPSGAFRASDRTFYINSGNDNIFQRLMGQVLERPDVAADADYATGPLRIRHRERLFALPRRSVRAARLGALAGSHARRRRALRIGAHGGRGDPLARGARPRTRHRIPHPVLGWVPNVRLPIRYAATPMADPVAAPAVGQHTQEVLRDALGLDERQIAELERAGAFGPAAAAAAAAVPGPMDRDPVPAS